MSFTTSNTDYLIRSNLWSNQLKEMFLDELMANKYVDFLTGFTDGDTFNIPSIGQAEVRDYQEGTTITYNGMDTGNFTFSITDYKYSGTYITEKMKQDSFYTEQLISRFVPSQARAIQKAMEVNILAQGPNGQTAGSLNNINNAAHRWIGSGTGESMAVSDFIKAKYSLAVANVPMTNLVAIVDPSVEVALASLSNIVTVASNPMWDGIVRNGMSTGMKFLFNIYGFDVYVSHNLKKNISETINGKTASVGVANLFFSASQEALPIVGSIRQQPKVDSKFNQDFQREEYVTTCRYGFKLYRPENMITVITDTDTVTF